MLRVVVHASQPGSRAAPCLETGLRHCVSSIRSHDVESKNDRKGIDRRGGGSLHEAAIGAWSRSSFLGRRLHVGPGRTGGGQRPLPSRGPPRPPPRESTPAPSERVRAPPRAPCDG